MPTTRRPLRRYEGTPERAEPQNSAVEVNAAIASSLIAIAETLHAIQAHVEKLSA